MPLPATQSTKSTPPPRKIPHHEHQTHLDAGNPRTNALGEGVQEGSACSYATAIRYALENRLEVIIEQTTESGEPQWVIRVLDDPSFWMEAVPTKAAAVQLSQEMGWKIV